VTLHAPAGFTGADQAADNTRLGAGQVRGLLAVTYVRSRTFRTQLLLATWARYGQVLGIDIGICGHGAVPFLVVE
jgi:hypothetical protein